MTAEEYPTSPPWAPPPADRVTAPYVPHGRLMVPYPEEMANAARPAPPSWVPVVVLTVLFGPLAAWSAVRRARVARRGRNDRHPYWFAFGAALTVQVVAVLMVAFGR